MYTFVMLSSLFLLSLLQVPRSLRAPDPVRVPGDPEHTALPHDEGGREEEGEASQLQTEGSEGRVQRVQKTKRLKLYNTHAHRSHHGKH